jgi:hypothetical protein
MLAGWASDTRDHLHEEQAARGHTMTWQVHTEDPECAATWDGACTDCGAGASAFAGGSSASGLGKDARSLDCSGPGTGWQNDMLTELHHRRISAAVADFGQGVKDIGDRQWLADQGIGREAGE